MFRAKIANGVVKRGKYGGPQPPAADMEQMVMLRKTYKIMFLAKSLAYLFKSLHKSY